MANQMIVRIDPEVKKRLMRVARGEGKTTSQIVRELIEDYMKERDIGAYVTNLWDRVGAGLKSRGVTRTTVRKAVKGARKTLR